jgi:hypothetical protein
VTLFRKSTIGDLESGRWMFANGRSVGGRYSKGGGAKLDTN